MEIGAAVASAATVIQLVDFAGNLLKATTTFIRAITEASKDVKALHNRLSHIQSLFEQIRRIANLYQNSSLSFKTVNKYSFSLLSAALTHCAQDIEAIKKVAQKPAGKYTSTIIKWKRNAKHVIDEDRLKRSMLRLDGHIIHFTALLSCISM